MKQPLRIVSPIRLRDFDPDFHEGMNREQTREKTKQLCDRIGELHKLLYANARHSVLILLQGMDTSGKDGAARRVLDSVNPGGIETTNFKTPSSEELAHDFLWRVHKAIPRYGNIGIFNRSHYEDVLIVRVMKLQPENIWRPRFAQINAFEKFLSENRVVLLKFFLHISKQEQARRLQARVDDPRKNWKFDSGDLKIRERWSQFQSAYEEAINRCSTKYSPWQIVPANHKWYRDHVVARIVAKALENLHLKWPRLPRNLRKIRIR